MFGKKEKKRKTQRIKGLNLNRAMAKITPSTDWLKLKTNAKKNPKRKSR